MTEAEKIPLRLELLKLQKQLYRNLDDQQEYWNGLFERLYSAANPKAEPDLDREIEEIESTSVSESEPPNLTERVQRFERDIISAALDKSRGNKSLAAHFLGITRRILGYKIKIYNITNVLNEDEMEER